MPTEQLSGAKLRSSDRRGHIEGRHRSRTTRATEARRKLQRAAGGRVWINGREIGGRDDRYSRLGRSHD